MITTRISQTTTTQILFLLALGGFAAGCKVDAQESALRPREIQTLQRFSRSVTVQQELKYLLYLPDDYDTDREAEWPLLLFLHGAAEGNRAND